MRMGDVAEYVMRVLENSGTDPFSTPFLGLLGANGIMPHPNGIAHAIQQFLGGHGHFRLYFQAHGVPYPFNRLIFNLEMRITPQNNPELAAC